MIDIRDWGLMEMANNPDIALMFVRQGKGHLLPGGGVALAMLEAGEAGADRLRQIVGSGVHSFRELDEQYDVTGKIRASADTIRGAALELDDRYEIRARAREAGERAGDAVREALHRLRKKKKR